MVMSWSNIVGLCVDNFPAFLRQHAQANALDYWIRGNQGAEESENSGLFVPNPYKQTEEHVDLSSRAYTPWVGLVISTLAQTMFLDGIRMPGQQENLQAWEAWQRNGWDAIQARIYRGALGHGVAYASALPGKDRLTQKKMPKLKGYSMRQMSAFYDEEEDDEFPTYAIKAEPYTDDRGERGWNVRLIDEEAIFFLSCKGDGHENKDWTAIEYREHNIGVTPIVRYTNLLDLDGRATGEVEPVIPVARRIDQDSYDRLIVQRYGAWKVRYITGLVKPKEMTDEQYRAGMQKLKVGDFLTSASADTKFGTLEADQLEGFIAARDADIRDFAAVTQIPPHAMLGTTPQMQPESLASVNSSLQARSLERKTSFGESHERLLRLSALLMGNQEEAQAWGMQVRWRDTETRSLSQTADALGKIATQLKVPVEMLWERIQGWTDSDTARAKDLVESGAIDALLAEFEASGQLQTPGAGGVPGAQP